MAVRRLAGKQPESFAFTPENEAWVQRQIAKYPPGRQASAVLPLLWQAQKQHDYWLPKPAIEKVAQMLGMPYIRVLEVATFYSMFNLEPVGRHFIQLCGTTPCVLRGAEALKDVCRQRIGEQHHVSADGQFAWAEVECLGACCNAPMVQVNDDYFEDLTPESLSTLMDELAAGRPVKIGSQVGRTASEPEPGTATTLADSTLFDGSRVGAWRGRFEDEAARAAVKAEAERSEAEKQAEARRAKEAEEQKARDAEAQRVKEAEEQKARDAEAQRVREADELKAREAEAQQAKEAERLREALVSATSPSVPSAGVHAAADDPASLARLATGNEASNKDLADPATATSQGQSELSSAQRAAEETAAAAKLVNLPADATPEQRADAVGERPAGLQAARNAAPDDLKRIRGIGPVNERKLNDLGIFHFDQIGRWTRPEVMWVGTYLAFPGRIDRERWVEQAAGLAGRDIADQPVS